MQKKLQDLDPESKILLGMVLVTILVSALILLWPSSAPSGGEHHGEEHGEEHGHEHEETPEVVLTEAQLSNPLLPITQATVGPATLKQILPVRLRIQFDGERYIPIAPRFPGRILSLPKGLGDTVQTGDVLAVLESYTTRGTYSRVASMAGVVIEQRGVRGMSANPGEAFMAVADLSQVWVECELFEPDASLVAEGQTIVVQDAHSDFSQKAAISFVTPFLKTTNQTRLVRTKLANPDGRWRPGDFATGVIEITEKPVALAVANDAIQFLEDKPVVFVRTDKGFHAKSVELGARGATQTEILHGLEAGESYVATQSFLLKAQLLKSQAGHEH